MVALRSLLPIVCVLFLSLSLTGQKGCGTEPYKDPWLTEFQKRLDGSLTFRGSSDTVLYVPMTIHMVGNDRGTGYFPISRLLIALCQLNTDFEGTDLQFYIKDDIRYLNNTAWFDHDDIRTGAEMMFENNVDNTINCYIVQDPAGNCGYNLPYAGVALSKSCIQPGDHTWAHEIGHNLSLPHPFLGWEGGQTHDNSKPAQYNRPAPETVTYDYTLFKDVYYPDTLIIDTALVEKVDGSNCRLAADGFCDTRPDYLALRWPCGQDSFSSTRQLDPDSSSFLSDGRWIMSYSFDNCNLGFSEEQILAMHANLKEQKPGYIEDQTLPQTIPGVVQLVSPLDEELVPYQEVELLWENLGDGIQYVLEVSRISTFGFLETQEVLDTNAYILNGLQLNRRYYWRVTPFDHYNFCADFPIVREFTTQDVTSTQNFKLDGVDITYTTNQLRIDLTTISEKSEMELMDLQGRILRFEPLAPGVVNLISLNDVLTGVYVIAVRSGNSLKNYKIFID